MSKSLEPIENLKNRELYLNNPETSEKGWTQEDCFKKYVQSEKHITLEELADKSGFNFQKIRYWAQRDKYKSHRRNYQARVRNKIWSIDDARKLYVESEQATSLREVSNRTGQSISIIHRTSRKENWPQLREEFQTKFREELEYYAIANLASDVTARNRKIAQDQYMSYKCFSDIIKLYIDRLRTQAIKESLKPDQEDFMALVGSKLKLMNTAMQILDRAIQGQQKAIGLEYTVNHEAAVSLILSKGYGIRPQSYLDEMEGRTVETLPSFMDKDGVQVTIEGAGAEEQLPGTIF